MLTERGLGTCSSSGRMGAGERDGGPTSRGVASGVAGAERADMRTESTPGSRCGQRRRLPVRFLYAGNEGVCQFVSRIRVSLCMPRAGRRRARRARGESCGMIEVPMQSSRQGRRRERSDAIPDHPKRVQPIVSENCNTTQTQGSRPARRLTSRLSSPLAISGGTWVARARAWR